MEAGVTSTPALDCEHLWEQEVCFLCPWDSSAQSKSYIFTTCTNPAWSRVPGLGYSEAAAEEVTEFMEVTL